MIDRHAGIVEADLAGQRWRLCFDYAALTRLQGLDEGFQLLLAFADRTTIARFLAANHAQLPGVLAAGLARHHGAVEDPAALLAPGYRRAVEALADAIWVSLADPDPDPADPPNPPPANPLPAAPNGPGRASRFGWLSWLRWLPGCRPTTSAASPGGS